MNYPKITGHTIGPAISGAAQRSTAVQAEGAWRGYALKLAPAGATQALAQAQALHAAALPMVQVRDLASRRVIVESQFRRTPSSEILQRAQTMGVDPRSMRATARAIVTGGKPPASGGRSGSVARYMALQLAASALEDDVSEEAATALLTPVRRQDHTPQQLPEMLRKAANDDEDFQRFREDVLAGLDTTPDDEKALREELWDARHDDKKLMEVLRRVQGLPVLQDASDPQDRMRLRQRIQDQLREFERSNEGATVLASFNAAPRASRTADPVSFLQTYVDLVAVPRSFAAALKLLLSRYQLDSIEGILDNLKKALGDDLAAATPSQDTRRLGAVLTDLGNLSLSSSLIERVKDLVDLIGRREVKRQEDERKRKRGGADGDGDEDEDGKKDKKVSRNGPHR
jgi:hypothetical protein